MDDGDTSPRFLLVMSGDKGELVGSNGRAIEFDYISELVKAARDNHNLTSKNNPKAKIATTPSQEFIQRYENYLIVKTSLPTRFGMYKPSKSVKKIDDEIEIEEVPEVQLDSASDPNHKFRSIF